MEPDISSARTYRSSDGRRIYPSLVHTGHQMDDGYIRHSYTQVIRWMTDISFTRTERVKEDTPVYRRARRLSPSEKDEVNRHISEWLRDGIIRPSLSEYASPVLLVKKLNGTTLCIDFREVNLLIV